MRAGAFLLDLLYPPRCPFCRILLPGRGELLCAQCQQTLPWLTGRAAERTGEFFALCVSPLRYRDAVRESVHRYKFSGLRGYAPAYGRLMVQCAQDRLPGRYDLITWVPLSAKRRRKRGYDQARLLAQVMAGELNAPILPLLTKLRDTPPQSAQEDAAARRGNALDAYEAALPEETAGKRILLVDDVVTSGATLSECARVLLTAGAAEVVCVTLAQAGEFQTKKGENQRNNS